MNEKYIDIMSNPENYWIRLESMAFIMLVNKTTNQYTNLYKRYGSNLEAIKMLCDMHPSLEDEK